MSVAWGDGQQDALGTHERVMFWGDAGAKGSSSASGTIDVSAFKGVVIYLDTLLEHHKVTL